MNNITLEQLEHNLAHREFHLKCFRNYGEQALEKRRELQDTPITKFLKRVELRAEVRQLEEVARGHERAFKELSKY